MKLIKHLLVIDGGLIILALIFFYINSFAHPYCGFITTRYCGHSAAFIDAITSTFLLYPALALLLAADILYTIIYFAIKLKNSTINK